MDNFLVPKKYNRNVFKAMYTLWSKHRIFVPMEDIIHQVEFQMRNNKKDKNLDYYVKQSLLSLNQLGLLARRGNSEYALRQELHFREGNIAPSLLKMRQTMIKKCLKRKHEECKTKSSKKSRLEQSVNQAVSKDRLLMAKKSTKASCTKSYTMAKPNTRANGRANARAHSKTNINVTAKVGRQDSTRNRTKVKKSAKKPKLTKPMKRSLLHGASYSKAIQNRIKCSQISTEDCAFILEFVNLHKAAQDVKVPVASSSFAMDIDEQKNENLVPCAVPFAMNPGSRWHFDSPFAINCLIKKM